MTPGGVFLAKTRAPSSPPMVEKIAPRKSMKMKLKTAIATRMFEAGATDVENTRKSLVEPRS